MGQGFKVYSSSELYCKWPKVAETMTEALQDEYSLGRISILIGVFDDIQYAAINDSLQNLFKANPPLKL